MNFILTLNPKWGCEKSPFRECECHPHTPSKWGCDSKSLFLRAIKHPRCLDIPFITNIDNFSFGIHHTHILICGIRYAIYFSNVRKNIVKMFKPWLIRWRCTNYLKLFFDNFWSLECILFFELCRLCVGINLAPIFTSIVSFIFFYS